MVCISIKTVRHVAELGPCGLKNTCCDPKYCSMNLLNCISFASEVGGQTWYFWGSGATMVA